MQFTIEFQCRPGMTDYYYRIADEMVRLFGISLNEAAGRINQMWHGRKFLTEADELMLYHDDPDRWANVIYYGPGSRWWLKEDGLAPQPYQGPR